MKKLTIKATSFNLPDETGKLHSLSDYKGKWLVLYFYPKDETPGCTIEACSLRDARDDVAALGAVVVGISRDNAHSHSKFKTKHSLNFTLLTDADHEIMGAYGAWGKKQFGREGVLRKTFIINPSGHIVKTYGRVTPVGHGNQIIFDLQALQTKD